MVPAITSPSFGRLSDPVETHKLPLGECPKFLSEALDRGMVGDEDGLVDPCAHGQV
jgi:hypothetical protein